MSKPTCVGRVWSGYGGWYPCGRGAAYEFEGKHYCKTHHPPSAKEKEKGREAKRKTQAREEQERLLKVAAHKAEIQRRADLYPQLLEAVKLARSIIGHPDDAHCKLIDAAIAKAEGKP